ncbi:uracil-xanthine permease family protein [Desulfovibrio ferrophilus]|nr:uracil-xanthine permease family protein [Desulfovibrio ferrophilus]
MMAATDYSFRLKDSLLGAQMLFVAFGALVLVPLLTGLDPNVALFTAGAGTLLFQAVTKRQVPVFLASSFAFIAPIIYGVQQWGIPATMSGLAAAGVFYMVLSALIKIKGSAVLHKILPPIVTGPVIMVIGLILAKVAIFMAVGKAGDGSLILVAPKVALWVSMVSLGVTVAVSLLGGRFLRLIPILCGIVAGYALCLIFDMTGYTASALAEFNAARAAQEASGAALMTSYAGANLVDFSKVAAAQWLSIPNFVTPEWNWKAVAFIVPVAIAPAIEHFGDVLAIGSVTGKDYLKSPGIHRTMLGDGLATTLASCLGGPPNTTYSEVTGAVALTKVFNPGIMTWAAITAILLAFVGKLGAVLSSVPTPVMGGIMILLFGAITVVGMNALVRAGKDLMEPRNLSVVAIILVFGIGGMSFGTADFSLGGIGLAGVTGVLLNLILPGKD